MRNWTKDRIAALTDIVTRLREENEKWLEIVEKQRHQIERLTECLKIRTSECRNLAAKINSEVLAEREECAVILDEASKRQRFGDGSATSLSIFADEQAAKIRNQKP